MALSQHNHRAEYKARQVLVQCCKISLPSNHCEVYVSPGITAHEKERKEDMKRKEEDIKVYNGTETGLRILNRQS